MPQKPSSPAWNPEQKQAIREISATIGRLLAHYWTAADRVETRQAQIEDWVEDLAEFGAVGVREACREWRQTGDRRPLPADIRALCVRNATVEAERRALTDERRNRWPRWLEDTWGSEPEGPRKRAEALAARHA